MHQQNSTNLGPVLTEKYLGNLHQIFTFLEVTIFPYDSNELCTGFVV